MEYGLLSHKNTRYNLRSQEKYPPSYSYYSQTEPEEWKNLVGLYATKAEAMAEFEREVSRNRKWIQLILLGSREVIRSQLVFELDVVVGRL
jgi:hypothetical protein